MNSKAMVIVAGIALAAASGVASAHERVSFGISIGIPAPLPVYTYPAQPVYVPAPPVVYYPPVYFQPPAPAYYPPARVGFGYYGGWHREHERREHERREHGWRR